MSNEVNNFLFRFIWKAVKPVLDRLPLGSRLKAEKLPLPCFLISHKIPQNCDTSIKVYPVYYITFDV